MEAEPDEGPSGGGGRLTFFGFCYCCFLGAFPFPIILVAAAERFWSDVWMGAMVMLNGGEKDCAVMNMMLL